MNAVRAMSLCARVLVGTSWAMCMVVLGLALLLDGLPGSRTGGHAALAELLGLAAISAGIFVFMAMVADRLVPHVGRRMTMFPIEMALFLTLVCSSAAAALLFFRGPSA